MPKSKTTKLIEKALMSRAISNNKRFALEVDVQGGIVDCLMSHVSYYVTEPALMESYEIKVTLSDFKSKNGHNFYTHYNYYVVPKKLYPKIKDLVEKHIGILTYNEDNGSLRKFKDAKMQEMSNETIIQFMDKMLLKWVSGSMVAEFKRNGFSFKNDAIKCPECGNIVKLTNIYKGMCYNCFWKKDREQRQKQTNLF